MEGSSETLVFSRRKNEAIVIGQRQMSLSVYTDTNWSGLKLVTETHEENCSRRSRILSALGLSGDRLPEVDDENLVRYYEFLSEHLSFPFAAHYPEPTNLREEILYKCAVLELLDPSKCFSDEFDGIICKTRKGDFEVNLPLVELEVPQDTPNFQLIEDYWYWF
jgi:hypothetical protein